MFHLQPILESTTQRTNGDSGATKKSDLFEFNGAHYLLSVDYYSKWIEIAKLSNFSSNNTICHFKSQFAKYCIPDELISDNGPQHSSLAFKEFSNNYGTHKQMEKPSEQYKPLRAS